MQLKHNNYYSYSSVKLAHPLQKPPLYKNHLSIKTTSLIKPLSHVPNKLQFCPHGMYSLPCIEVANNIQTTWLTKPGSLLELFWQEIQNISRDRDLICTRSSQSWWPSFCSNIDVICQRTLAKHFSSEDASWWSIKGVNRFLTNIEHDIIESIANNLAVWLTKLIRSFSKLKGVMFWLTMALVPIDVIKMSDSSRKQRLSLWVLLLFSCCITSFNALREKCWYFSIFSLEPLVNGPK